MKCETKIVRLQSIIRTFSAINCQISNYWKRAIFSMIANLFKILDAKHTCVHLYPVEMLTLLCSDHHSCIFKIKSPSHETTTSQPKWSFLSVVQLRSFVSPLVPLPRQWMMNDMTGQRLRLSRYCIDSNIIGNYTDKACSQEGWQQIGSFTTSETAKNTIILADRFQK